MVNSSSGGGRILLNLFSLAVPGLTVFIIIPSAIFYYVEEGRWTYLDSMYYAFVSLTTIGYGDLISEHEGNHQRLGKWVWVYQAFTIVWLIFGLSFGFMINLMMMDHLRAASKKCMRKVVLSSKKSIRKFRKVTPRLVKQESKRLKEVMHPRATLKRAHSAPCLYSTRVWLVADEQKCLCEAPNGCNCQVEQQVAL